MASSEGNNDGDGIALPSSAAPPPDEDALSLLTSVADLLANYVASSRTDRTAPVVALKSPDALASEFARGGVTLSLVGEGGGKQEREPPLDRAGILKAVMLSLANSVRTSHPRFFGQLYGRPEASGIAGDWLAAACSAAVHTFEAAPVFVLAERAALAKLGAAAGGKYFDNESRELLGDGLFLPGGSAANLAAMVAARHVADPEARHRGSWWSGGSGGGGNGEESSPPFSPPPRLVAFVSEHAHFSFDKAAIVSGLGLDNLVKVPCEEDGSMSAPALEQALSAAVARGLSPFFVGATCGTTVLGAFDPLRRVSEISLSYGCWLHADASWGGSALFSPTHKFLLDGLDLCDSFCVSPHKALGVPLQCSALVTRHAVVLSAANGVGGGGGSGSSRPGSASAAFGGAGASGRDPQPPRRCSSNAADYLYQPERPNAEHDVGDRYGGCGRRGDGFKFWLLCKSLGDSGLASRAEAGVGLASYAAAALAARPAAFRLVRPPSYANVCFWYIPQELRPLKEDCLGGVGALSRSDAALLARSTAAIKAALQEEGSAVISFARFGNLPPFFRLVFASAWTVRTADVDALLDAIEEVGGGESSCGGGA